MALRMTRRSFLQTAGYGLTAMMVPSGLPRNAWADVPGDPVLVVLFLRGGADGINLVVPRGDNTEYLLRRPTINVPAAESIDLDGYFHLHPGLADLKPLYDQQQLAIVHAVGGTENYSHFEAQDAMEFASPGGHVQTTEGWLHNTLATLRAKYDGLGDPFGPVLTLKGVSLESGKVAAMAGQGESLSVAFPSISDFQLTGNLSDLRKPYLDALYRDSVTLGGQSVSTARELARVASDSMHEALDGLAGLTVPDTGIAYQGQYLNPKFAGQLKDAATLIDNPGLGVRAIALDLGGWDHHFSELASMAKSTSGLAAGLKSFYDELAYLGHTQRVLTLVMTEFGRTAHENGTNGTDHGWGSVMFVIGGNVNGGQVVSRGVHATPSGGWPGLALPELHVQPGSNQSRDLAATTDFREVFLDVIEDHFDLDRQTEALPVVNVTGDFVPGPSLGLFG
jgi:uncharacterized protein (DUF1501 family)